MWRPDQHSDEENLRWAWPRAIEWQRWPLFVSQPIVPVLLYVYPWQWVVITTSVIGFAWWFIVASRFTPSTVIDLAVYFVYLRFATAPVMAYLLLQNGRPWIAALALSWPLVGTFLVGWVLMFPEAALAWTERAKAAQIGMIQRRFMSRFGYVRTDLKTDLKEVAEL